MKSNLNLFALNKSNKLSNDAQKNILGGAYTSACGCGCYYQGCGGSSSDDNACANADRGVSSPYLGFPVSEPGALCR